MTEINYTPQPGPQTEILQRSEFELGYGGQRGGGKTFAGFLWLSEDPYFAHPKYRALVIRRNAKDLDDWIFRARDFWGASVAIGGQPSKIKLSAGGEIICGHMADADAWDQYQGHEYQKMLFEELTQIPTEEQYLRVIASCRSTVDGLRPQVMSNFNPGGPGHSWVRSRFVDAAYCKPIRDAKTGRTRIFVPAAITDNQILMSKDPDYVKGLQGLPDKLRRAWLEGDWDAFEGSFFTIGPQHEVDPFKIPDDAGGRLIGCLDHGIAHPTSFGIIYIQSATKCYHVCSYRANGMTTHDHAEAIWDMINGCFWLNCQFPAAIYFDPAMATQKRISDRYIRSDIDEYKDVFASRAESAGVAFVPGNNRKPDGCNTVRTYLDTSHGDPIMSYFRGLNGSLVSGLRSVEADENNPEIYAKQDGDDDADRLRYGLVAARGLMATLARQAVKYPAPVTPQAVATPSTPYRDMFVQQAVYA